MTVSRNINGEINVLAMKRQLEGGLKLFASNNLLKFPIHVNLLSCPDSVLIKVQIHIITLRITTVTGAELFPRKPLKHWAVG